MTFKSTPAAAAAFFLVATLPAYAAPGPLRGTIDSLSGQNLVITARNGRKMTIALPTTASVIQLSTTSLAEIKTGSYVGTAALPEADGTLRALEVQVFPESMRGVGEGTRDWNLKPQSSMTNGTVGQIKGTSGRTITITYKGGEKKVVVPPNVPVVTYGPGQRSMLVPGAHVILFPAKAADGSLSASRVTVGKNGLVPPM